MPPSFISIHGSLDLFYHQSPDVILERKLQMEPNINVAELNPRFETFTATGRKGWKSR